MNNARSKILDSGVSKSQLESLEKAFIIQFHTVLTDYDIDISKATIQDEGAPILFDVILELGQSENVDESVAEYVDLLLDEFGTEAGRNNVHFLAGRIAAEQGDSKLAEASKQLYGSLKKQEMER